MVDIVTSLRAGKPKTRFWVAGMSSAAAGVGTGMFRGIAALASGAESKAAAKEYFT